LLVPGGVDNTLETAFSKVESGLRKTLIALENAAKQPKVILPQPVYENMCWYCSFLFGIAPYAKPGAVISFLYQLNMELEKGWDLLLKELRFSDETISELKRQHAAGRRVIVESVNLLQLLYRWHFARNYQFNYLQFLRTKWVAGRSPIEFPMSDVDRFPTASYPLEQDIHGQ